MCTVGAYLSGLNGINDRSGSINYSCHRGVAHGLK